jgi:nucleoside-diphosphate-sugar epimerase
MVQAFAFLSKLRVLPLRADHRIDIVPVDYVAEAIVKVHLDPAPPHGIYHLASGEDSQTYGEITGALAAARHRTPPRFWPRLGGPFAGLVRRLAGRRGSRTGHGAARLQVFWPYLTYNTVFDNRRVVAALGRKPEPFTGYCWPLLRWSLEHRFAYPYREYPA